MSDVVVVETVTQVVEVSQGPQGAAGPGVTISATPPINPVAGDWWIQSTTLQAFVYYDDGSSAQWVGVVSGSPNSTTLAMVTLNYASTVTLDMASVTGQYCTITLNGDLTLASSGRAAGRSVTLRLLPQGSSRTLTFPAGWVFVGTKPTTLAANKTAVLSITFFGSTDADAVCAYAVQT